MKIIVVLVCILVVTGCGGHRTRYNNEYLYSATKLEKALEENPNAVNRKTIEQRIKRFYQFHKQMLEIEREREKLHAYEE